MYSVVLMMALSGNAAETPALFNRGCSGCSGCYGCSGCRGNSCCGGRKHGFFGGRSCRGCNGCHGCSGYSCCGCSGYSCHGCTGYSCHGCTGGAPVTMPAPEKKPEKIKKPPEEKEAFVPAPATIVVTLPADAQLSIDDHVTTSTSAVRTFVSPALEQGKDYVYNLTAKIEKDGKAVTITKQVKVTAGAETRVNFEATEAVAAR